MDLVIESTGKLRSRDDAAKHLKTDARRVLISAPGKGVEATIVPGVNGREYDASSCRSSRMGLHERLVDLTELVAAGDAS